MGLRGEEPKLRLPTAAV